MTSLKNVIDDVNHPIEVLIISSYENAPASIFIIFT